MERFESFAALHQQTTPLLLGNAWNVPSAKAFEAVEYAAIGLSSHAVAQAAGYDDGEQIPFEDVLKLAQRIVKAVNIPLSVDLEAGYSRHIDGIKEHIDRLCDAGVVGINLEDTLPGPQRIFQAPLEFARTVDAIAGHLARSHRKMFLNLRTDGFLLGLSTALHETLDRIKVYENAGAHGIFVPCITQPFDIKQVVQATPLPINVMCMPNLPSFDELAALGVRRISMGPYLFSKVYEHAGALAQTVRKTQSFAAIV